MNEKEKEKQELLAQEAEKARVQIEKWAIKNSLIEPEECIGLILIIREKKQLVIIQRAMTKRGRRIIEEKDKIITKEDWRIIESCLFSLGQRYFLEPFKKTGSQVISVAKLEKLGFSNTFSKMQGINRVLCVSGLDYRIRTVGEVSGSWQEKSLKLFAIKIAD